MNEDEQQQERAQQAEDEPLINEAPRLSQGSAISNRSLGRELPFGEVRQHITSEEVSKAWSDFCLDIMFLLFVVAVLELSMNAHSRGQHPATCGIPIQMWHEVLVGLFGARALANHLRIYIIRNFYSRRQYCSFVQYVIIDGILVGWLVYGNALYYSEKNNCGQNERTAFLEQFMGCILIFGYVLMGFYLLVICTLPCFFYLVHSNQANIQMNAHPGRINHEEIAQILQSLSKVPFGTGAFTHESQCAICLIDFKTTDLVTQLECDSRHYYHTDCIETWIRNGNNSCPICRRIIHGFDVEQEGSQLAFDVA